MLSKTMLPTKRISSALIFIICTVLPGTAALAQQPAAPDPKLAKVEFVGLKRLTHDQLLKTSGLQIGETVNQDALDAAGQRLMDSGLVHRLSYRFQVKGEQGTVIFQIEEGSGKESAVTFDNFIWFSEEQLGDAVRREVPSFNGTAPAEGQMTDAILKALKQLLAARKIAGTVEYLPSEGIDNKIEHVFRVKGVRLPICSVHFPGARHVEEARLVKSSHDLLLTDYSRSFASTFALSNLFPIYKELGHLRATFGRPQASPQTIEECKDGVEVTIPVEEGAIYVWNGAEWSGNQVLTTATLDSELNMKSGEIANGIKFDTGIAAALKAYARKGYLEASVRPQPDYDDAARKVSYHLDVKEGPQYHMGNLNIKGFSDPLGNYLRGKWEMRRDDVYDQGYVDEFFRNEFKEVLRKVVEERQSQGRPAPKKVDTIVRPNRETRTVDITFEIGDESTTSPGGV